MDPPKGTGRGPDQQAGTQGPILRSMGISPGGSSSSSAASGDQPQPSPNHLVSDPNPCNLIPHQSTAPPKAGHHLSKNTVTSSNSKAEGETVQPTCRALKSTPQKMQKCQLSPNDCPDDLLEDLYTALKLDRWCLRLFKRYFGQDVDWPALSKKSPNLL